jgi:hypothetical protein
MGKMANFMLWGVTDQIEPTKSIIGSDLNYCITEIKLDRPEAKALKVTAGVTMWHGATGTDAGQLVVTGEFLAPDRISLRAELLDIAHGRAVHWVKFVYVVTD